MLLLLYRSLGEQAIAMSFQVRSGTLHTHGDGGMLHPSKHAR